MSSQKGNSSRNRPQKHQNRTAFKNSLHDTSKRTKTINSLEVSGVCQRCKEKIEWRIKYKKYKPLTQPKKCVKCEERNVRHAYHVMCAGCGSKLQVCTKCCKKEELVVGTPTGDELQKLDGEMKALLQSLPERKRRTFIRYMNKKKSNDGEDTKDDFLAKLNSLKVEGDDEDEFEFTDSDEFD